MSSYIQQRIQQKDEMPFVLLLKQGLELVYRDGITRILDWQTTPDRISGRFLDGAELFSFMITPEGISYAPIQPSRKDAYLVGALAQAQGMTEVLTLDSLEHWTGFLLSREQRTDRGKQCRIGRACGDGCVSRDKACQVKTAQVRSAATGLLNRANVGTTQDAETLIRQKEDEIRLNPYETAIIFDEYGNELFRKKGDETSVGFTYAEIRRMKGKILTHNHPPVALQGSTSIEGGSFSREDLMASCYSQLREVRAVAPEGRYSMKPPKEGWSENYWKEKLQPTYDRHFQDVYGEIIDEIRAGKIEVAKADREIWHRVAERTATELGMEYRFMPTKVTPEEEKGIREMVKKVAEKRKQERKKEDLAFIGNVLFLTTLTAAYVGMEYVSWQRARKQREANG